MNTITQTLTLAQLREDLERLASAHPGSYPTNVIEVIHQCGEITVDAENEEDALREELKNAEDAITKTAAQVEEYEQRAEKAEEEALAIREEMMQLRDPSDEGETVLSYRERTLAAEKRTEEYCQHMRDARHQVEDMERELKALRARKGVTAGVFKHVHALLALLNTVANHTVSITKLDSERAKALLQDIRTT